MYNTREIFVTHKVRTEHYGKETLSYLGPKIWNIIPNEIKSSATFRIRNTPYGVYGKTETPYGVFRYRCKK